MTSALDPFYEFRDEIVKRLERDLVGPDEAEETINDKPLERYVSGILYPQFDDPIDPAEDDNVAEGDDEGTFADPPVALANEKYPSSTGMTFAVDVHETGEITISTTAAMYADAEVKDGIEWVRRPLSLDTVTVPVDQPVSDRRIPLADGLELFLRVRAADAGGAAAVTVALVNKRVARPGKRDTDSFFQVGLTVETADGVAAFVERDLNRPMKIDDADLRSYHLLYRDARTFAVGHGCSVDWDVADGSSRASRVATTFVPRHALLLADSNPTIRSDVLSFRRLVEDPKEPLVRDLHALFDRYGSWIAEQQARIPDLQPQLRDVAEEHLALCRDALERIRDGILVLDDPVAWEAFRLANRAMLQQRARASWLRSGKPSPEPDMDGQHEWRPFQLAFILQCLRGIVDPRHPDRDVADLLWFPTGGGKTEAYLGLIAFTVFLRRLRRSPGDGVTVIMRYTLRLLTIQQFDRAALLIALLRADPSAGRPTRRVADLHRPVGRQGRNAEHARRGPRRSRQTQERPLGRGGQSCAASRLPMVRSTPWPVANTRISTDPPYLRVRCRDKTCLFREGIPVVVVDDDIYRLRPTLIIATSDKFATIPWRAEAGALFNRGSDSPPPELIVQDELHLISGPLGTLAGLYETAIDFLCTEDGAPAEDHRLDRDDPPSRAPDHRALPPSDASVPAAEPSTPETSWFAAEADPGTKGTRLYVGLMAPGTSPATLMIRAYASLLQSAQAIDGDGRTPRPVLDSRRLLQQPPRSRRRAHAGPGRRHRPPPIDRAVTTRDPSTPIRGSN